MAYTYGMQQHSAWHSWTTYVLTYVRTYVRGENISSIQSLTLMRSAMTVH